MISSMQSEVIKTLFSELNKIIKDYEARIDVINPSEDFCHSQERLNMLTSKRRVGYLIEAFTGKLLKMSIEQDSFVDQDS